MKTSIYARARMPILVSFQNNFSKLLWSCLAVLPLTMGMGFHPLHPRNPPNPQPILQGTAAPGEVKQILQQSCGDCHSDNTVWPWYSHIAPLSWMIESDVHKARRAMNLSNWSDYSNEERQAFLREIPPMIQSQMMPLPRYTAIHRNAKLSDNAIRVLSLWTAAERHKLRLEQQQNSMENDNNDQDVRSAAQ